MRFLTVVIFMILGLLLPLALWSKVVVDTLATPQNDKIIVRYGLTDDGNEVVFDPSEAPRIIPSDRLRNMVKGNLSNLKVVIFDRMGNYTDTKWKGMTPATFMVPAALRYEESADGFFILGQSSPVVFSRESNESTAISMPVFIAIYEGKQSYKLVASVREPLEVELAEVAPRPTVAISSETQVVAITSEVVEEGDNADVVNALSSIDMVRQMLAVATELPLSQQLQMETYNLRSLKSRITDQEVIEKINKVLLEYADKEKELGEKQKASEQQARAEQQALAAQQKQEEMERLQEIEQRAAQQEEKQQKRTLWMVIGGAILMVLCFVGNAVFRHFKDLSNQRSMMEMQNSLARQAEQAAVRQSQAMLRNKTHKLVNVGKNKMREKIKETGKNSKKNNIKSI